MDIIRSALFWLFSILFAVLMFPLTVLIWLLSYPFDKEGIIVHWWLTFQGIVIARVNMLWRITIEGRDRPFVSIAKYACACGPDCKCDTISQKPGKCSCGMELAEVKAEAEN